MKVLHISTNDISGGAAKAAYRLHVGMLKQSRKSQFIVAQKNSSNSTVILYKPLHQNNCPSCKLLGKINRFRKKFKSKLIKISNNKTMAHQFDHCPKKYGPFSTISNPNFIDLPDQIPQADVVNLHWISKFVDFPTFFCHQRLPNIIVWTLHDMNAFTGGCHYDYSCGKFNYGCGCCPQLNSKDPHDLSHQIWLQKKEIYDQIGSKKLHLIAPSQWLADKCSHSVLLNKFPIKVIPYGLDLSELAPREKTFAREVLGIPENSKVLMFVAHSMKTYRKNFASILNILPELQKLMPIYLLTVGANLEEIDLKIPHQHAGYIQNERLLSLIYSAADIFLTTSLEDNLPNTIIESLACGTPVVGFAVGGIPEMIENGVNGHLVPPGNNTALIKAVFNILSNKNLLSRMAQASRQFAKHKYSDSEIARRYQECYRRLID